MSVVVAPDTNPSSDPVNVSHVLQTEASASSAGDFGPLPRQRSNSMPSSRSIDVAEFVDGVIVSGLDVFSRFVAFHERLTAMRT